MHLDPSIYLMDDENKTPANMLEKSKEANHESVTCDDSTATEIENNSSSVCGNDNKKSICPGHVSSEEGSSADQLNKVSDTLESINLAGNVSGSKGQLTLWVLLSCLKLFRSLLRLQTHVCVYLHDE